MVFFVCGFVFIAHVVYFSRYTVDDAYISYRYSENFADGHGLVFNHGEKVEGYSNFLWVLILGLLKKGSVDVILASKVLGLLSLLVVLIAYYLIVHAFTGESLFAAASLWLLVTNFGLVFFSVTGMETGFYTAFILWGGYLFYRNESHLTIGLSLIAVVVALTRPEGILFFPALVFFDLIKNKRFSGRLLAGTGVFSGLYALFLFWRYSYYGAFLPNTYYAKLLKVSPGFSQIIYGFDDIYRFIASTGGPLLLGIIVIVLFKKEIREKVYALFPILAVILVFQIYSSGDWMDSYRFLVPMLPAYLVIGLFGLWWLLNKIRIKRTHFLFLVVIAFIGLFNIEESANFYLQRDKYPNFVMTSEDLIPAAKWVGEYYPSDYTIVCGRIGALPYYSRLNLIDTVWGLTDEYVAHSKHRGEWTIETEEAYLHERNPELVMMSTPRDSCLKETIQAGRRIYKLVRHFRQGSEQWWVLYERGDLKKGEKLQKDLTKSDFP
jgi:arabinofuranosyltransferase